ncbi:hypothetical protein NDR87_12975 [Nocardia sp. CDC159]|uniref:Uncharacterized protein n=1 Tax=Nocardia pulmonis TaxID=2951408 RepID=A0A9X2E6F7_9NOCA|nr:MULTISPECIES: hypothetical protein [Nocardia]MCM6774664.1 hypothetical protein [Nocardia pulmonis]MCM6787271.1 hypothetical protein [Nocardia sp. CDC159]
MTAPDGKLPDGVYSGKPGGPVVRSLAKVTEASARAALQADVLKSYTPVQINMAKVMEAGFDMFAANLCDAITGLTGGLIDLSGWARRLRADAERAMREARGAQQSADTAQQTADSQTPVIKSTSSRVQVVVDGLPLRPYWETMNLTEESSFPRTLLHSTLWGVAGQSQPGWEPLTFPAASGQATLWWLTIPRYTPQANSMEGAFIRCLYDGGRRVVTYIPDDVSNPCELYVVVGRMLDTGDVKIEWVSENQTPLITNSRFERSVQLPNDIVFSTGETAYVGIHQRGSGNPRQLLGIPAVDIPRSPEVWPPQIKSSFASSSPLTAGSVIPRNGLKFTSIFTPYLSLGKALITGNPMRLSFFEDFEEGMPESLVRMSSLHATVEGGVFVVSGLTDGQRRYIYGRNLNYDDQMVAGRVRNPTERFAWLVLRSDVRNSSCVALGVNHSSVHIFRVTGAENFKSLAGAQVAIADNAELRLRAVGNMFTAEMKTNGAWATVVTYPDTDNVIPKGPAYRFTGLGTERQSWTNGGGWGDWKAEDL